MLNEDQQELISLCKTSQHLLETNTKELNEAKEKLLEFAEALNHATEDIQVLLAFIKSHNLQPPKTHQA